MHTGRKVSTAGRDLPAEEAELYELARDPQALARCRACKRPVEGVRADYPLSSKKYCSEAGPTANYRVMFSLFRKDHASAHGKVGEERGKHLSFVMAPEDILIRNSFHMLSEDEKQARRTECKR